MASWGTITRAGLGVLLVAGSPRIAAGQTAEAIARADAQFVEGKRLLGEREIPAACSQLAASYALAPRGGTLLNLALCHEQEGKLLLARGELKAALARAQRDGRADREPIAIEHLSAIDVKLSWLEIIFQTTQPNATVHLAIDGTDVERDEWKAVPVEPGTHSITSSAFGFRSRTTRIEVAAISEHKTVRLEPLEPVVVADVQMPPTEEVALPPAPKPTAPRFYTRPWFWGVVGAALVGGAILAIRAGNHPEYPMSDVNGTYP